MGRVSQLLRHALSVAALSACSNHGPTTPLCTFVYGGTEESWAIEATSDPYTPTPITVGERFAFRAVYLKRPRDTASFNLYVYAKQDSELVLLQQLKYRPPYPRAGSGSRDGFTGRQFLYTPEDRELEYWCEWRSR